MKDDIAYFVLVGLFSAFVGAGFAHGVTKEKIAEQCKRQGSFYVGKDDFKCEVKK